MFHAFSSLLIFALLLDDGGATNYKCEDLDLWPLVTPLCGDISDECRAASIEYIELLTGDGELQTEDQISAWRRFDSNGAIPFLQEGKFQDVVMLNICDFLPEELSDICNNLDGLTIPVPYGNAAGPGMEAECRNSHNSKYCFNYASAFPISNSATIKLSSNLQNPKIDTRRGMEFINHKNPIPRNVFFQQPIETIMNDSVLMMLNKSTNYVRDADTENEINLLTLPKLSDILITRNSYIRNLHSSLMEIMAKAGSEAPGDLIRIIMGKLIFIWLSANGGNGPGLPLPFAYQGACYPGACSKRDISMNNIAFSYDTIFKYDQNGTHIAAFAPLVPYPIDPTFWTAGCSDDNKYSGEWKTENYVVVYYILTILGFFILVGTAADILGRFLFKIQDHGLGYDLLTAFSLMSNMEFIFQSTPRKGSNRLDCFDGMRAISMTWVILGHNFLFGNNFLHGRNREYTNAITSEHAGGLAFEVVPNGEFSVDSFLFIGATLLSFLLLKDLDKSNGWFHAKGPVRILFFYLNRYLRITVPYALVLAVYIGVLPLMITKPMGAAMIALWEGENCKHNWWRHLLYYNIYGQKAHQDALDIEETDSCLGQTWYLAFDMNWFIVSPLVIYPLWRTKFGKSQKILGLLWWSALYLGLFIANFAYTSDWQGWEDYHATHNLPIWNFAPWGRRSHCYMLGLMMGYILHNTKDMQIKITSAANLLLWSLAFLVGFAVVYGPYNNVDDTTIERRAYYSLYKTAWGLCLSWVTFACVKGYGGPINDFLCWGLWSPISKISFMTYLFHMSFNWYYFAMQDYNVDFTMWLLTEIFVAQVAVCLFIGLIGCLTLELPFGKIQKLLMQRLLGGKH